MISEKDLRLIVKKVFNEFIESEHPRDEKGMFTNKGEFSEVTSESKKERINSLKSRNEKLLSDLKEAENKLNEFKKEYDTLSKTQQRKRKNELEELESGVRNIRFEIDSNNSNIWHLETGYRVDKDNPYLSVEKTLKADKDIYLQETAYSDYYYLPNGKRVRLSNHYGRGRSTSDLNVDYLENTISSRDKVAEKAEHQEVLNKIEELKKEKPLTKDDIKTADYTITDWGTKAIDASNLTDAQVIALFNDNLTGGYIFDKYKMHPSLHNEAVKRGLIKDNKKD